MIANKGSCAACAFYWKGGSEWESGECHAQPPSVPDPAYEEGVRLLGVWPPVRENSWCGRFAPDAPGEGKL